MTWIWFSISYTGKVRPFKDQLVADYILCANNQNRQITSFMMSNNAVK